jgi:hypothetical protein
MNFDILLLIFMQLSGGNHVVNYMKIKKVKAFVTL